MLLITRVLLVLWGVGVIQGEEAKPKCIATAADLCKDVKLCTFDENKPFLAAQKRRMDNREAIFAGGPIIHQVPILSALDSDTIPVLDFSVETDRNMIRDFIANMVPFILRNMPEANRAKDLWTLDYIQRTLGSRKTTAKLFRDYVSFSWDTPTRKMNISSALDLIASERLDHKPYLQVSVKSVHNSRHKLFNSTEMHAVREVFQHSLLSMHGFEAMKPWLRVGPNPLQVGLHYDSHPNFMMQVQGTKRIVMMHPLDEQYLQWERHGLSRSYSLSTVQPRNDNIESKWPLFKHAAGIAHSLKPGEIIHLPPLWWHYIEADGKRTDPWVSLSQPHEYCFFDDALEREVDMDANQTFPRFFGSGVAYLCAPAKGV